MEPLGTHSVTIMELRLLKNENGYDYKFKILIRYGPSNNKYDLSFVETLLKAVPSMKFL